mgnify:CR=1 FL=1
MTGVNFGHVVFAQVRQLIANMNKKNFKATSGELSQAGAPNPCMLRFTHAFCCVPLSLHGASQHLTWEGPDGLRLMNA